MKHAALISVTERGRLLTEQIAKSVHHLAFRRFCFHRYTDQNAESFDDLSELTARLFRDHQAIIFVCACGIAVRMIAPHILSKQSDPAVIAADDRGNFVIPLLSGHLGGANALARVIADAIGAQAVITTATDIGGQFSPDSFAAANHLLITDFTAAKEIAAAVLKNEPIGFRCAYPYQNLPPELAVTDHAACGIVIADTAEITPYPITLHLIPRNIVVGIGCKKGISAEQITDAVTSVLTGHGISMARICKAASIDLKAEEPGLLQFCETMNIPLHTFSAEALMKTAGTFSRSQFVEGVTGTDNVCERSAVLCSGGNLTVHKTAVNGVTVAAAEIPVQIDFEKRMI